MRARFCLVMGIATTLALIGACAPAAPTPAPTKPPAPAAPTVAPKAPAAPTPTPAPAAVPTKPPAPTPTPAPKIKRGGVLKTTHASDWATGDVHLDVWTRFDQTIHHEALMTTVMNETTKRFELAPELAASWEQADPKSVVFKLQRGVKFHDGSDWNATAAKWNLLRMRDHPKSASKDSVRGIASIDVVDDYTIKVNLTAPSASALWLLSISANGRPVMMSKEAVDKYGEEYMTRHYFGTGPFELVEWREADRQIFKRFAQYYRKGADGQPLPYLDGLEVRWIQDVSVAMVELKTGNLHLVTGVQARDVPGVRTNPELVLQELTWTGETKMLGLYKDGGLFTSLKLRQAAQYAIDRGAMASTMGLGTGKPGDYIIAPGQIGYSDKLPKYTFDLAKATQLVKDAGYPSGVEFKLTVISRQPDLPQAEVVKAMLDKAGFKTIIDTIERVAWSSKIQAKNFEATTYSIGYEVDPYITLVRRFGCQGNANWAMWCSPKFDACLEESEQATNDEKRGEILQRCYQIAYEEAAYVHLWIQALYDAQSKKVQGWIPYRTIANYWPYLWLE